MKYEYKFLEFRTEDFSAEQIQEKLSELGAEGWKILNYHPTSDRGMRQGSITMPYVPWDLGYTFLLEREIP